MSDRYLAYFDTHGFECVYNITKLQSEYVQAILADKQYQMPFSLYLLKMRAQFNGPRRPEIWFFNVDAEISEQEVRAMAKESPQALADFIRSNGENVYGAGIHSANQVIE